MVDGQRGPPCEGLSAFHLLQKGKRGRGVFCALSPLEFYGLEGSWAVDDEVVVVDCQDLVEAYVHPGAIFFGLGNAGERFGAEDSAERFVGCYVVFAFRFGAVDFTEEQVSKLLSELVFAFSV